MLFSLIYCMHSPDFKVGLNWVIFWKSFCSIEPTAKSKVIISGPC
jgi:hypothetical protein